MLPGQMITGKVSEWQLKSVLDISRNLPLKFHQNQVSNSWDIADIEFCGGVVCKVIFASNLTKVMLGWGWAELGLSWGFDNIYYLLQNCVIKYETAEW